MAWHWVEELLTGEGPPGSLHADPWIIWRKHRQPPSAGRQVLCARADAFTPDTMRQAGWFVPSTYSESAAFFTARCAGDPPCAPPPLALGNRRAIVDGGNDVNRDDRAVIFRGNYEVSQRPLVKQLFARAQPQIAGATSLAKPPVIGIIDSSIAFLHGDFRNGDRTRIRALWDQGQDAATNDGPWRLPERLGYGREIQAKQINRLIADKGSQGLVYQSAGHRVPRENWSHGTQVLSLAAGARHPRTGQPDSQSPATRSPIIAVQLPDAAFERTHGVWTSVYVLDALRYIVDQTKPDEAVVVNISLGGNTGPHDGTSLLERAIDQLIDAEQGRLTVVIAAGNSREAGTHASVDLGQRAAAGQSEETELAIQMLDDDPTSNFVEAWFDIPDPSDAVQFQLTPPSYAAAPSGWLAPGHCARLENSEGKTVAMLWVGEAGRAPNGRRAQALMAVGQTRNHVDVPTAPSSVGRWRLAIRGSSARVDAWVARDDSIIHGLRMKAFTPDTAHVVSTGTLSALCGARRPIVVGGYTLSRDASAAMYEPSASGFAPGHAPSEGARRGPDMCAAARLDGGKPVRFCSDDMDAPVTAPSPLEGTSLAAPLVVRALVGILATTGPMKRETLLDKLRAAHPTLPINPSGKVEWTSEYWLPVPD